MFHNNQLNIYSTINSGQYFLWENRQNIWYGIYEDTVLKISPILENNRIRYEYDSFPKIEDWEQSVFRLDDNYDQIINEISKKDLTIEKITKQYRGLRIMRQKPIQCIISFLCSSNNNIPRIRLMLRNLSRVFGKTIEWKGDTFHTFPTLAGISSASQAELLQCGLGYRAVYIQNTVKSILNQDVDMKIIEKANYTESKLELMKLCGVGEKIADCILLFSLDKLDAFPIDTWIVKLLQEYLNNILVASPDVKINSKLSPNQYKVISKKIRDHYGKYSGYAQQFLYYSIRERNGRKW